MIKTWMKIIVLLSCCYPLSTYANTANFELKYYSKASYYLGQGKYKLAAKQWHQLSVVFLRSEAKLGNRKMWQYAGLAEALAAISADKANDVVAYQYWADSTRYLMTGGTNWPLVQKQLHQRFETTSTQLSAFMQVNDLAINDSDKWQQDLTMLQVWSDKLSVFTFTSPKLGLMGKRNPNEVITPQSAVNYNGTFQPNKKLSGLGSATFRGNQITPVSRQQTNSVQPLAEQRVDSSSTPAETNQTGADKPVMHVITSELSQSTEVSVNASEVINTVEHIPLVELTEIAPKDQTVATASSSVVTAESKTPQEGDQKTIPTTQNNPLARGSMATIEDENVEALQRRSFAPIPIK